jgi:hypothetical protein
MNLAKVNSLEEIREMLFMEKSIMINRKNMQMRKNIIKDIVCKKIFLSQSLLNIMHYLH